MGSQREFAEILMEKMGSREENTPSPSPIPPRKTEEFPHWRYHFASPRRSFSPRLRQVYPASERPTNKTPKTPPPPSREPQSHPVFKIGELGMEYSSDLVSLQLLGADLDPAHLSLPLLKREFRQLAKKWHPDQSQDPDAGKIFQSAQQAYKNLRQALEQITKN